LEPIIPNNSKPPIPKPVIYSLIFIGFGLVSAILCIIHPFTIVGTCVLEGFFAILYSSIIAILLLACIYGIIKRKYWALKATIIWYAINILILFFNFIIFARNIDVIIQLKQKHDPEHTQLYTPANASFTAYASFLLGVIFALYIIINLYRNKDYFDNY
jgi:hypothetical protein